MADYTEAQKKRFETIGKDRYPIGDKSHARAALARINQGNLSHEQKMIVMKKAQAMLHKGEK